MTPRRGALTYVGGGLIVAGAVLCCAWLAIQADWFSQTVRMAMGFSLLGTASVALAAMAARARWPRLLAPVLALVFPVWIFFEGAGGLMFLGTLLLVAGGVLGAIGAILGSRAQVPAPALAGVPPATVAAPTPAPVVPATPADWYPDPLGLARLRYWNGSAWTDHVAT